VEIIISDNGSTDSTPRIVEKMANENPKIRYFRSDQNHGLVWNFNRVFRLSTGEYFMWASHDDEHADNYISRCLLEIKKEPTAALCAPNTIATWGIEKSKIWKSSLDGFENRRNPRTRYHETLRNFPAVALYGLYRSSYVNKTKLIPRVVGGDLLFIQNLSIYGDIIGFNEPLFFYHQREKWNSTNQDYYVFMGKRTKPRWYSPFLLCFYWQIKLVIHASVSRKLKSQLLLVLIAFKGKQFIQKIGLKMLKFLIPGTKKISLAKAFYWRYLHSENIEVLDHAKFEERIIKPTLKLN
jgi:glycosyltransferase involved in cell wall biosynthesis